MPAALVYLCRHLFMAEDGILVSSCLWASEDVRVISVCFFLESVEWVLVFSELNREHCLVECLVISTLLFGVEWFKLETLCATCPLPCQKCPVILVKKTSKLNTFSFLERLHPRPCFNFKIKSINYVCGCC